MFCPKCGDLELEPVKNDKIEYLACINGCEGVWIKKDTLEKGWGKKRFKTVTSELVEIKQKSFDDKITISDDLELPNIDEHFEHEEDHEVVAFDDDEGDTEKNTPDKSQSKVDEDDVEVYEDDEDEEDDDEVEEVNFSEQRDLKISSFITEDGEYDESASDANEGFNESSELIEEDDDEAIEVNDEETFLLSSPVSGNPMKRYTYTFNNKSKCMIGECEESESYWIDGSDEILTLVIEQHKAPKNFADLLAYERPEEEIFEDEDEDEDDEL